MSDRVTILTAASPRGEPLVNKYYAKAWDRNGEIGLPKPYLHTIEVEPVTDLWDLSDLLYSLEDDPNACIIRGQPNEGLRLPCRRQAINFEDVPHHWVCFDFDSIPGQLTPEEVVSQCLPREFHNASFHWQYSGSQGFKEGTRLHCWFWMDRPVNSAEWLRWLASHGADDEGKPLLHIDPALYHVIQVHITANPVLRGVPDPVAVRSGTVQGDQDVVPFRDGPYPAELPKSRKAQTPPPPPPEEWQARQTGVIGAFNLRFRVGEVLEWFGYQPFGKRYLHPKSTSLVPDTVINSGTHAYAFSPNNPLYKQGMDRETGEVMNRNHDAFDCFRILGHGGDEAQAIAAASELLAAHDFDDLEPPMLEVEPPYPKPLFPAPEAASEALSACMGQFLSQEVSPYWERIAQYRAAYKEWEENMEMVA